MIANLKSFRPAAAIAAVIVAGAVLASCSSATDGEASPEASATTAESTTAESATPGPAAGSSASASEEADITEAANAYLAAVNSGKVDTMKDATCAKMRDAIPADTTDGEPLQQPIVVDKVENIMVDGDTATADVTASLKGAPDVEPEMEALAFANENGWKVCQ